MDTDLIEEETSVPIIPHHTGSNKNDDFTGVYALSVMFERGRIRLPYKTENDQIITDRLINELHEYPSGKIKDQVMALWITKCGVDRVLDALEHEKRKS